MPEARIAVQSEQQHIAIIPARSGSKGVKDKNIRLLGGIPLLGRAVQQALEAGVFDNVYCSTDSEVYAVIAREYGASVPFLRTPSLASDDSPVLETIKELLNYLQQQEVPVKTFTLLQVTSPFRTAADIRSAFNAFSGSTADSLVSLCPAKCHPHWMRVINDDNVELAIERTQESYQRQQLPKAYQLNGAIYITSPSMVTKANRLLGDNIKPYVMPLSRSIDIDTEYDWAITQWQFEHGFQEECERA